MKRIALIILGSVAFLTLCMALFEAGSGGEIGAWPSALSTPARHLFVLGDAHMNSPGAPTENTTAGDPSSSAQVALTKAGARAPSRLIQPSRTALSWHGKPAAAPDTPVSSSAPQISAAADSAHSLVQTQGSTRIAAPAARVPLVFQGVDLFVQTSQGLRYVPLNDGSHSAGASASAKPGAPGTLVVDESTAAAIDQLRQDFVNAVGGLNQNADDPAYLQRWRSAQFLSDQHFRSQYGDAVFNRYQIAAAQKAEAERQAVTNP